MFPVPGNQATQDPAESRETPGRPDQKWPPTAGERAQPQTAHNAIPPAQAPATPRRRCCLQRGGCEVGNRSSGWQWCDSEPKPKDFLQSLTDLLQVGRFDDIGIG